MKKKTGKKEKSASMKERLFQVFLILIFILCLVSFFVTSKQLAQERTQFVTATGAVSADVAADDFITAALGLSLLLLVLAALILGIATYLVIQINKNNHIEFMAKQTFIDLIHKIGGLFKAK